MPTARASAACAVLGGKVYVLGGVTLSEYLDRVEEFDPATGKWANKPRMPLPRGGAPAVSADRIYVLGGRLDDDVLNRVDIYSPVEDSWTEGPPMPERVWQCMAAVAGNRIYVFGGIQGIGDHRQAVRHVQILDLATNRWSRGPDMPFAIQGAGVAVLDGKIYIVGGREGAGVGSEQSLATARVLVFDPATGKWSECRPMESARTGLQAVAAGNRVIVAGGAKSGASTGSIDCYDPAADRWQGLPGAKSGAATLRTPVTAHCAAVVGNKIYVFGGYVGPGSSAKVTRLVQEVEIP
ncbi:MAG: kelch repeat-containing protein [bacterium]|nr:kelch repeat-containing protein [bacterium]